MRTENPFAFLPIKNGAQNFDYLVGKKRVHVHLSEQIIFQQIFTQRQIVGKIGNVEKLLFANYIFAQKQFIKPMLTRIWNGENTVARVKIDNRFLFAVIETQRTVEPYLPNFDQQFSKRMLA